MRHPIASDEEITTLVLAADVAAAVARIYDSTLDARGLIHVASVWQGDRGRYVSLAKDREAPQCHHEVFAVTLARARADAILTTGRALRQDPDLDHRLRGPGSSAAAVAEWRRDHLGKTVSPITLVVTSRADLDLDHPIFHHWTRPVVLTTRQNQWQLESRAIDSGVEVVGVDAPTPRVAIDFLRHAFGAATIALEIGTQALQDFAEPPVAIDEVLLAVDQALRLPATALGLPFLTAEQLIRRFPDRSTPYRMTSEGHEWCLQRFRR